MKDSIKLKSLNSVVILLKMQKKFCSVTQTSAMISFIKKNNSFSTKQLLNQSVAKTTH